MASQVGDPAFAAALLAALGTDAVTRLLDAGERVIAEAFAGAERTGRLGDEWYALVDDAPATALTSLVTLATQSGTFLDRVAVALLGRTPEPGWSPRDLVAAYDGRPLAFQQLLADHPREARVLLEAATGDPASERTLRAALAPDTGADGLRARALTNLRTMDPVPWAEPPAAPQVDPRTVQKAVQNSGLRIDPRMGPQMGDG
ncbi:hypothetical protein ACFQYP_35730 [Nonomuraea antimicrobica]